MFQYQCSLVDEFYIWNHAKEEDEIEAIFQAAIQTSMIWNMSIATHLLDEIYLMGTT